MATKKNTKASTKRTAATKGPKGKKAASKKNAPGRAAAPVIATPGSKLARELATLGKLGKTELWKRYEEVFGHKTRSCNTDHLRSAIAQKLHEATTSKTSAKAMTAATNGGGTSASAVGHVDKKDPRMPRVGTVLEREHKGVVHKVKVVEDGFEYKGQKHRSLSGLAKLITGQIWNGWVWFSLAKRPEATKGAN